MKTQQDEYLLSLDRIKATMIVEKKVELWLKARDLLHNS